MVTLKQQKEKEGNKAISECETYKQLSRSLKQYEAKVKDRGRQGKNLKKKNKKIKKKRRATNF